jgi:transcriptional repressor NrdR
VLDVPTAFLFPVLLAKTLDKYYILCYTRLLSQYSVDFMMHCPYCGYDDSKVVDSRSVNDGIRRRRQCLSCDSRFTTYERLQPASLFVIKKDGRHEEFSRDKLLAGIRKACEKRPLPIDSVDKLTSDIEAELYRLGKAEISSGVIGDMVMEGLKNLDYIAYIRFASVYREFADITTLKQAVDTLLSSETEVSRPAGQLPLLPDEPPRRLVGSRRRRQK